MVRLFTTTVAVCFVITTALAVPVGFAREGTLEERGPWQSHVARDLQDYKLHYREIEQVTPVREEALELEARNFWQSLKSGFSKVANFVAPVAKIASKFIREEDAAEHAARSLQDHELHFHHYRDTSGLESISYSREDALEVRNFWQSLKKGFSNVVNAVAPVAKIATKFIRDEDTAQVVARDLQDHELHFHHYREDPVLDSTGSLRSDGEFDLEARWESPEAASDFGREDFEEFTLRELEELD